MKNANDTDSNIRLLIKGIDFDILVFCTMCVVLFATLCAVFIWSDWINYLEAVAGVCRDSGNGDIIPCIGNIDVDVRIK